MKQLITRGIILHRTEYGEADRIVTLLTPDQGKLRLMARGVRKQKSKLAGGIELFSVSSITFIRGKGDLGTLISARLETHYGNIVKAIDRVQTGYDLIKLINKETEDEPEAEYFELLEQAFAALNTLAIDLLLIKTWFLAQLLRQAGHTPNLRTELNGSKLNADKLYDFNFDDMSFLEHPSGAFGADHIKYLRLLFSNNEPVVLAKVQESSTLIPQLEPLIRTMQQYLRP